jgi:hypothetical protein
LAIFKWVASGIFSGTGEEVPLYPLASFSTIGRCTRVVKKPHLFVVSVSAIAYQRANKSNHTTMYMVLAATFTVRIGATAHLVYALRVRTGQSFRESP